MIFSLILSYFNLDFYDLKKYWTTILEQRSYFRFVYQSEYKAMKGLKPSASH